MLVKLGISELAADHFRIAWLRALPLPLEIRRGHVTEDRENGQVK